MLPPELCLQLKFVPLRIGDKLQQACVFAQLVEHVPFGAVGLIAGGRDHGSIFLPGVAAVKRERMIRGRCELISVTPLKGPVGMGE